MVEKRGNKFFKPHPKSSFMNPDKKSLCEFTKDVKPLDMFGSSISNKVAHNNTNMVVFKSHACHLFMEWLITIGVIDFLSNKAYNVIVELQHAWKSLLVLCGTI